MPYITPAAREALDSGRTPETAGELNYLFSRLASEYLVHMGLNYQHINDIVGALEGAKLELYRRVAINYEGRKLDKNGDVYSKRVLL